MAIQERKCRKCKVAVSDEELTILMGLMALEVSETIDDGVAATGLERAEVIEQLLRPLLNETPVCVACFNEVNSRTSLKDFMAATDTDPCFTWERIRLAVLDA